MWKRGEVAIELILVFLLGAGAYVGWNIGANDTANCVGTTVGCGLISFRNAVILVSIFAILGVMLQGQQVMIPNNFYALNGSKIFSNML